MWSDTTSTFRIVKTDGGELIGKILEQDEREILLLTKDNRRIYVPQHAIQEIIKIDATEFNEKGTFIGEDAFATRYFLTTNGLPIKKGEHYIQWNLFGPDFQFGLGKNFGVGIMSSWFGVPLVGTIKKSWELNEYTQFALGGLFGTGSWAAIDVGGALPFATLSFGNRTRNIAFSGGYGAIFDGGDAEGRALMSVAGMAKVGEKISLVFDSFIVLSGQTTTITNPNGSTYTTRNPGIMIFTPGIRIHQEKGKAFQFGFTGLVFDNDLVPFPIPTVQWYRSL